MWFLVAKGQCSRAASFGAAALLPLEMVLNSGPYSLCVAAVKALGEIEDQRVVRLLLKALKSNDAAVCAAAVDALAQVGGLEASEPIIGMLHHKNGHVRLAAVEALGSLGVAAAAAPLRALVERPDVGCAPCRGRNPGPAQGRSSRGRRSPARWPTRTPMCGRRPPSRWAA